MFKKFFTIKSIINNIKKEFDEKHDYSSEVSVYMPGYPKGDLLYVTTTWMFTYGVPWEAVEVAGDELGLRENTSSNGEDF